MLTKEASYQVRVLVVLPQQDASFVSITDIFAIMKKRLRKKLRLREFQQMGFYVDFNINLPLEDDWSSFWFAFGRFLKTQGLQTGCCYMTRPGRKSATDADREAVANWIHQQPDIFDIKIWPLDDAWHGPFKWL